MTSSMADVLAQLREVLGVIDHAAVAALRAQTDAHEARHAYQEAGTGTKHTHINQAITQARTAGEKAGKVARLLAEAASAYADYINTIAPGTVPARHSAPEAMPSGEILLEEAAERSATGFGRFTRTLTTKADDLGDTAKDLTNFVERAPHGRGGTVGTVAPSGPVVSEAPAASLDELTGALVVVGAIAAAAAKKIGDLFKRKQEHADD
jgi:hypothetical protein